MEKQQLEKLRNEIDILDKELLNIIRKRFKVTEKVGLFKAKNNLPVEDLKREAIILKQKKLLGKKHQIPGKIIADIFNILITAVKKEHRKIKKEWNKKSK